MVQGSIGWVAGHVIGLLTSQKNDQLHHSDGKIFLTAAVLIAHNLEDVVVCRKST